MGGGRDKFHKGGKAARSRIAAKKFLFIYRSARNRKVPRTGAAEKVGWPLPASRIPYYMPRRGFRLS